MFVVLVNFLKIKQMRLAEYLQGLLFESLILFRPDNLLFSSLVGNIRLVNLMKSKVS